MRQCRGIVCPCVPSEFWAGVDAHKRWIDIGSPYKGTCHGWIAIYGYMAWSGGGGDRAGVSSPSTTPSLVPTPLLSTMPSLIPMASLLTTPSLSSHPRSCPYFCSRHALSEMRAGSHPTWHIPPLHIYTPSARCVQALLPHLEAGSRILHVSSGAAHTAYHHWGTCELRDGMYGGTPSMQHIGGTTSMQHAWHW